MTLWLSYFCLDMIRYVSIQLISSLIYYTPYIIYLVILCDGMSAVEVANNAKKNCGTTVPVKIRSFAKNMDDTST